VQCIIKEEEEEKEKTGAKTVRSRGRGEGGGRWIPPQRRLLGVGEWEASPALCGVNCGHVVSPRAQN